MKKQFLASHTIHQIEIYRTARHLGCNNSRLLSKCCVCRICFS